MSNIPTVIVDLPSRGRLYPKDHPLANGEIEMRYMTAKDEDILSNQSYINKGVVLDKLFQSLIVTEFDYNDLLSCDKNMIMIQARILGYGAQYPIKVTSPTGKEVEHTVDLKTIKPIEIDWDSLPEHENEFKFTLPVSEREVTFSLLTHGISKKIAQENKAMKKLNKDVSASTTMKYLITSIDGNVNDGAIRKFVDNELIALDAHKLRQYIKSITPELNLEIDIPDPESGDTFPGRLAIGMDFFWPDYGV